MVIGGFLDGRRIIGDQLDQADYPAYFLKLKNAYPAHIASIKESIPPQAPDASPSIATNDLIEPAYRILLNALRDFDWEEAKERTFAIYKAVGERTMGNMAFDDCMKTIYRAELSSALPEPSVATFADAAYLAHEILTDKLECLYQHKVGAKKLADFARAIEEELKELGFDLQKLREQSKLNGRFGVGYELMLVNVSPFDLYDSLWMEKSQ